LFSACASPSPQHDRDPKSAADAAKDNEQTAKPIASPLEKQPDADRSNNNAAKDAQGNDANARPWGPTEWSATIQAGSAVIVMFLTAALVWYSHRGWTAAQKAANAAMKSANTARAALVTVQRAFVTKEKHDISTGMFTPADAPAHRIFTVTVAFRNWGGTQAIDVIHRVWILKSAAYPTREEILGHEDHPAGYMAQQGTRITLVSRNIDDVLGPLAIQHVLSRPGTPVVSQTSFPETTYLVGWIAYRDIFGGPHVTQFCERLQGLQARDVVINGKPDRELRWQWESTTTGDNGIDKTCSLYTEILAKLPTRRTAKKQTIQHPE
jgi:hypothetical protein